MEGNHGSEDRHFRVEGLHRGMDCLNLIHVLQDGLGDLIDQLFGDILTHKDDAGGGQGRNIFTQAINVPANSSA